MKKLFVFAAALLALASCSQNEPEAIVQTREISFAPAATQTRATAVNETTTENLGDFAVWGYVGANNNFESAVFSKTTVKKIATNTSDFSNTAKEVWQPEGGDVKYWAPNSTYWFSAMYPITDAGKYSFSTTGTIHTQKITGFTIADGGISTNDIVVARPAKATLEDETERAAVGLTFDHMLARVRFAFRNGFADDNVTIEISNVELNGLIAIADATINSNGEAAWDNASGAIKLDFQDENDIFTLENKSIGATVETDTIATKYRLFIPTSVDANAYKLSFELVVKADNVTVLTKSYTVDVDTNDKNDAVGLKAVDYKNGKSYLFSATIDGDLLNEEIFPINFDVQVTDWAADQYMGDIF